MNLEQARFNMVEQQIRPWDVLDTDVLDLLMAVRREEFVPEAYRPLALSEAEIPLPGGQAMLRPMMEGRILQALQVKKDDQVLEIGAGSGYFAALLAAQGAWVRSIEIDPQLARLAHANLERYGVSNVIVEEGDGAQGWAKNGPYDVIAVSGSVPVVPQALLDQLAPGGRLFVVVGEIPVMEARLVTRLADGQFQTVNLFETQLAPLQNVVRPSTFTF